MALVVFIVCEFRVLTNRLLTLTSVWLLQALYLYPQCEYPYVKLLEENAKRTRAEPEYELEDTGAFNDNRYWDVGVEYCKNNAKDILIRSVAEPPTFATSIYHSWPD